KGFSRKNIKYISIIIFFVTLILLTGSRKALFILIFSFVYLELQTSNKYKYINFMKVISIVLIILYLIFNVEYLYDVIGYRIESLINSLTSKGIADKSTLLRKQMIKFGITKFKERPILGYGLSNYRIL